MVLWRTFRIPFSFWLFPINNVTAQGCCVVPVADEARTAQNAHQLQPSSPWSGVCGKAFSVHWFTLCHKHLFTEDSSRMSIRLFRGVPRGVTTLQAHSRNRRTKNILLKINIVTFQRYGGKVSNNMKLSSIFPCTQSGNQGAAGSYITAKESP